MHMYVSTYLYLYVNVYVCIYAWCGCVCMHVSERSSKAVAPGADKLNFSARAQFDQASPSEGRDFEKAELF